MNLLWSVIARFHTWRAGRCQGAADRHRERARHFLGLLGRARPAPGDAPARPPP